METQFSCPCCGFGGLRSLAYEKLQFPIEASLEPPYSRHFGMPSFEVCPCCGFEFGNDDEPGTGDAVSFRSYLRAWIGRGARWFDPKQQPQNWLLDDQLKSAGITLS
jgi:hypothetical protein